MAKDEQAFLRRLLATFKIEAQEHLKEMSALLAEMEGPQESLRRSELVESLFREAHSLKGAARAVNLQEVEHLCQDVENVLSKLKHEEITLSKRFFDVLYQAIDQLTRDVEGGAAGNPTPDTTLLHQALSSLENQQSPDSNISEVSVATPSEVVSTVVEDTVVAPRRAGSESDTSETVRISTAKLERMLTQIEELMAFKFSTGHLVSELHEINKSLPGWKKVWDKLARESKMLNRRAGKSDADTNRTPSTLFVSRVLDSIERNEEFAKALSIHTLQLERQSELEQRSLSGMLDNLLDEMKQALMLPFSTLFEVIPKLVRDLARDSGKEVALFLHGDSIEIDRRILEQMKAPVIHLIRNAIDHGLEKPDERLRKQKSAVGRISIDVAPKDGNKIELSIADDGAGLNLEKIRKNAVELGIKSIESVDLLSKQEVMGLIFESGLSTSAMLTDVSGRGLGMAIVREKVEKFGGAIEIEQVEGGGTRFRIVLPTTLATFRGLLVAVEGRQFVLPSLNVECVKRVAQSKVRVVGSRESIEMDGAVLPLNSLGQVLALGTRSGARVASEFRQVVVLFGAGRRLALSVDEVIGDQEVLVKSLGPQLIRIPNVAAVTVLDRGRIVPILNVQDLLKSVSKIAAHESRAGSESLVRNHSLLVVEDSITSRFLLKNILESAGYRVSTAVDGVDALTSLHSSQFDLVVSDVEMPRMDGFTLTGKIRADSKLSDIPVILVTTLDSREHKERGLEVGANAYIVKNTFDQSNLLDAIGRLI